MVLLVLLTALVVPPAVLGVRVTHTMGIGTATLHDADLPTDADTLIVSALFLSSPSPVPVLKPTNIPSSVLYT